MNAPVTDCRPDRNFSYQPATGMTFGGFDVSYGRHTELRVTERPGLFIGLMLSGRSTSVHIGGAGTVDVPVARPIFINFLEETQCTNSYRRGDFCAGIGIHLARTPSLTELSQLAAVNPGKLADNFRAAFGQTIDAYFRELRLTAARLILRCESASITETSLRVGFNSPTAFATAYRRHFG